MEKGEWFSRDFSNFRGFKALKQLVKLTFKLNRTAQVHSIYFCTFMVSVDAQILSNIADVLIRCGDSKLRREIHRQPTRVLPIRV